MNRSNLIESLEDRQLFSAYTLSDCMVSSYRAPEPQQVGVHVDTSPIDVRRSAQAGDGKILGNLLRTASERRPGGAFTDTRFEDHAAAGVTHDVEFESWANV